MCRGLVNIGFKSLVVLPAVSRQRFRCKGRHTVFNGRIVRRRRWWTNYPMSPTRLSLEHRCRLSHKDWRGKKCAKLLERCTLSNAADARLKRQNRGLISHQKSGDGCCGREKTYPIPILEALICFARPAQIPFLIGGWILSQIVMILFLGFIGYLFGSFIGHVITRLVRKEPKLPQP